MNATETRTLGTIARDIRTHWVKPYFGAVPYLQAMSTMDTLEDARRIKAELKAMLGDK